MKTITDGLPCGWRIQNKGDNYDRQEYVLLKDGVFLAGIKQYCISGLDWTAHCYATDNPIAIAKIDAVLTGFRECKARELAKHRANVAFSIEAERVSMESDALRVLM
jgi:hypothetical protein